MKLFGLQTWRASPTAAPALAWALALVLALAACAAQWLWLPGLREVAAASQAEAAAQALLPPPARRWPAAAQTPQRTQQLLLRAQREGLVVQRAIERQDAASATHSVQMQALGSYGAVRRFVAQALAEDAALALESLRLQRPAGPAEGLTVELQWRLLYQAGSESL